LTSVTEPPIDLRMGRAVSSSPPPEIQETTPRTPLVEAHQRGFQLPAVPNNHSDKASAIINASGALAGKPTSHLTFEELAKLPMKYTNAIAEAICERIADGESLRTICSDDKMPSKTSVFRWLIDNEIFRDQYARARETQADAIFDDILSIADDGRNDWMERNFGEETRWVENGEALRRSALRIDARKWMAGKLRPKKYGEKIDIEHSGEMTINRIERVIVDPANPNG
jgi:hypothetical protein